MKPDSTILQRLILTRLIENRNRARIVTLFVMVYALFFVLNIDAWQCPIKSSFGIPCPGCGLTHAIFDLIRGNWKASFQEHPFAPVVLIGILVVFIASILPASWHVRMKDQLSSIEQRFPVVLFFLILLFFYWIIHLIIVLLI